MMTPLDKLLIRHECLGGRIPLKPYRDTQGLLTIGIGRCIDRIGISEDEALYLFQNDKARVIASCRKEFDWFDKLDDIRKMVVIDMAFNLGLDGFKEFQKTLYYIRAGLYENAAIEMLDSKWAQQVRGRALELSEMMKTGEFPDFLR